MVICRCDELDRASSLLSSARTELARLHFRERSAFASSDDVALRLRDVPTFINEPDGLGATLQQQVLINKTSDSALATGVASHRDSSASKLGSKLGSLGPREDSKRMHLQIDS